MKTFTDCVDLKKCDGGLILTLKKGISPMDLIVFDCFDGNEKIFKYSGDFDKCGFHEMLIIKDNDSRFSYHWGNSTTMTSDSVWRRNNVIIKAMEALGNLKICRR